MEIIHEKIHPDGNIHLPGHVLATLGVKAGDEVSIFMDKKGKKEVKITPVARLSGRRGILKGLLPKSSRQTIRGVRNEDREFDY